MNLESVIVSGACIITVQLSLSLSLYGMNVQRGSVVVY